VNPNFQVDSQVKPTEVTTEHSQPIHSSPPPPPSSLSSSDIDNQTKLLMNFHERIIPNQYQREKIEEFIHLVEATLKSCSDRITTLNNQQSLIMGVSRVDLFVKNLLIKTDRIFQLVVICFQWPKRKLLEDIVLLFNEHLPVNISFVLFFSLSRIIMSLQRLYEGLFLRIYAEHKNKIVNLKLIKTLTYLKIRTL